MVGWPGAESSGQAGHQGDATKPALLLAAWSGAGSFHQQHHSALPEKAGWQM